MWIMLVMVLRICDRKAAPTRKLTSKERRAQVSDSSMMAPNKALSSQSHPINSAAHAPSKKVVPSPPGCCCPILGVLLPTTLAPGAPLLHMLGGLYHDDARLTHCC